MPNQFFTMPGAGGESVTISINNIASVQDFGNRIVVTFIQPVVVTASGVTSTAAYCEIGGPGIPLFRAWYSQHNR